MAAAGSAPAAVNAAFILKELASDHSTEPSYRPFMSAVIGRRFSDIVATAAHTLSDHMAQKIDIFATDSASQSPNADFVQHAVWNTSCALQYVGIAFMSYYFCEGGCCCHGGLMV